MPRPALVSLNLVGNGARIDIAPEAIIAVEKSPKDAPGATRTKIYLATGVVHVVSQGMSAVVNAVNTARGTLT